MIPTIQNRLLHQRPELVEVHDHPEVVESICPDAHLQVISVSMEVSALPGVPEDPVGRSKGETSGKSHRTRAFK